MAKKSTTTVTYKTKTVNGKTHMVCQNSSDESKYYSGVPCENYVPVSNKDVVSVLCSHCTSIMCSTPQIKRRSVKTVAKAAPRKKTVIKPTVGITTDTPKRKAGRPKKVA